jgi:hypothetical protein
LSPMSSPTREAVSPLGLARLSAWSAPEKMVERVPVAGLAHGAARVRCRTVSRIPVGGLHRVLELLQFGETPTERG